MGYVIPKEIPDLQRLHLLHRAQRERRQQYQHFGFQSQLTNSKYGNQNLFETKEKKSLN